MRFRLKTFLLFTAIAGPLLAYFLRPQLPMLLPRVSFSQSEIRPTPGYVPIQTVAVHEPGTHSRELRFAVVYHGTVVTLKTVSPPWYNAPCDEGLSICRTELFLDGKPVTITRTPCILVLDYDTRTFTEVPIKGKLPPFIQAADLPSLPEWKAEVAWTRFTRPS
jgi:hypothetical protein